MTNPWSNFKTVVARLLLGYAVAFVLGCVVGAGAVLAWFWIHGGAR